MGEPVRTCIGCGAREPQRALVRLVVDGGVVVAAGAGQGGRGAWLHPRAVCFEKAGRRKAFGRALRAPGATVHPGLGGELLTRSTRKD